MNQQIQPQETADLKDELKHFADSLMGVLPQGAREAIKEKAREIIAGVLIAVLALALFKGYGIYRQNQEEMASRALGSAIMSQDKDERVKALEEVVSSHSGSAAADMALVVLAGAYRDSGRLDKAAETFRRAQEAFGPQEVFHQGAILGIGYVQEEKGDYKKALESYDSARRSGAYSPVALLDYARVAAATGDSSRALEAYNAYISSNPEARNLDFVRYQVMGLSMADGK